MNEDKHNDIKENSTKQVSDLEDILQNFVDNMLQIKHFFDVNLPIVKGKRTEAQNKFNSFIDSHKKDGKILLEEDDLKSFKKILEEMKCIDHQPLLCNSSFLILINIFEYVTKAILRKFFLSYPKHILDKKELVIGLEELCDFKNLDELKEFMIERYLEKIFYKSFSEQQKIIQKIFDNKDVFDSINFTLLEKARKKRNLLAHNNGIINEKFAEELGLPSTSISKKLFIQKEEFEKTYQEILFFGVCFLVLLGKKTKDTYFLDKSYQYFLFSLLEHKNFYLIKRIYETTGKYAVSNDGISEIINFINYLLALKNIPEEKENYNDLLNKQKTGQLSDHFKCAFAVLKEDKKEFLKLLKNSDFTRTDWNAFPLFDSFKQDPILTKKVLPILDRNDKKILKNQKNSRGKNGN